jgi:PAS domain S-box-containing protein
MHPDDVAPNREALRRYLASETAEYENEIRLRHTDGSYRTMLARGAAVRDAAGKPIRFVGIIIDITKLKVAEEALRASEQRFRTFVDNASDAFLLHAVGEQGRVLDVNRRACESLGYTRDELIAMTPLDFDLDLTPALVEDRIRQAEAEKLDAWEARHRRKDGTVFPVELRSKWFREGGRGFGLVLARDITERKQAEEALRASERRFRTLTEALPNIVWTSEPDGAIDYVNARFTEYTGLTPERTLGRRGESPIHPEELPRALKLWTRSITTGELYENEFRCAVSTAPTAGTLPGRCPSATIRAGSSSGSGLPSISMSRSAPRGRCGRPRRRRRRPTGPRTSSWPTSATRSAPP